MTAALSFYQTITNVSFTLLGLWFVVLGLDPRWHHDSRRHRAALHTALCLFLPGLMGLGSVLSGGGSLMWRTFFVLGGLVGAVESLHHLRAPHPPSVSVERVLHALGFWPYAAVVAAALLPGPVLGLVPLQVEGLATCLVFLTGTAHLWMALVASHDRGGRGSPRGRVPPTDLGPARPCRTGRPGRADAA